MFNPQQHPDLSPNWAEVGPRIGTVTVFGAGVAGLTAAHELAERGFRVFVVEPDESHEGLVAVGGMARSQLTFGRASRFINDHVFPWTLAQTSDPGIPSGDSTGPAPSREPVRVDAPFREGTAKFADEEKLRHELAALQAKLKIAVKTSGSSLPSATRLKVRATVFVYPKEKPPKKAQDTDGEDAARIEDALRTLMQRRAKAVENMLATTFSNDERFKIVGERAGSGPGDCRALFEIYSEDEAPLPGEHGYRFFPSFYRHLFDTMRRTPIYNPATNDETHRTAFDNLVATSTQVFAGQISSATLKRTRPRSLEALRVELTRLLEEFKFDLNDISQFHAKLFRYLTTCTERRVADYESMTWWEFLTAGGVEYSAPFQEFLKSAPQALIALDAETGDARTQGNIVIQLLMDQLSGGEHTDCTLNGPTSEAWLDLWRDHLLHLGVTFLPGELTSLTTVAEDRKVLGRTLILVPKVKFGLGKSLSELESSVLNSDYFIVATDAATAERVSKPLSEQVNRLRRPALPGLPTRLGGVPAQLQEFVTYRLSRSDLAIKRGDSATRERVIREKMAMAGYPPEYFGHLRSRDELPAWVEFPETDDLRLGEVRSRLTPADPRSPGIYGLTRHDRFQTFAGVQYYFAHDLEMARGHVYYLESAWGLSSISPMQFWQRKNHLRQKGILGILSVDIGNFRKRSDFLGKAAHECNAEELAFEVWRQISESMRRTRRAKGLDAQRLPLPRPIYYHLDDNLVRSRPATGKPQYWCTSSPFLVNNAGDWSDRPGADPWDPNEVQIPKDLVDEPDVWQADHGGYQVHYGKLVYAGTYLRTFTRLTTMESANESARHAVNAILDHCATVGTVGQRRAARAYTLLAQQSVKTLALDAKGALGSISSADVLTALSKLEEEIPYPLPLQTVAGEYCKIWDPEKHELDELEFFKRVDKLMLDKQLPHMADVLGVDALARNLTPHQNSTEGLLTSLLSVLKTDVRATDEGAARGAKGASNLVEELRQGFSQLVNDLKASR